MLEALQLVGAREDVLAMPDGLRTLLGDQKTSSFHPVSSGASFLARAFLKKSPIMLSDRPTTGLDGDDDQAFVEALRIRQDEAAIILVSDRPNHARLADQVPGSR